MTLQPGDILQSDSLFSLSSEVRALPLTISFWPWTGTPVISATWSISSSRLDAALVLISCFWFPDQDKTIVGWNHKTGWVALLCKANSVPIRSDVALRNLARYVVCMCSFALCNAFNHGDDVKNDSAFCWGSLSRKQTQYPWWYNHNLLVHTIFLSSNFKCSCSCFFQRSPSLSDLGYVQVKGIE